jgi:hypothetical protein
LEIIAVLGRVISEKNYSIMLKIEAINLCIALVLGGNSLAQRKFYDYFQKDHKNMFLLSIRQIIFQQFKIISNKMEQVNSQFEAYLILQKLNQKKLTGRQKKRKKLKISEDSDDDEEEESEDDEDDTFEESIKSKDWMIRVFRLLQLFCEGHNYVM